MKYLVILRAARIAHSETALESCGNFQNESICKVHVSKISIFYDLQLIMDDLIIFVSLRVLCEFLKKCNLGEVGFLDFRLSLRPCAQRNNAMASRYFFHFVFILKKYVCLSCLFCVPKREFIFSITYE